MATYKPAHCSVPDDPIVEAPQLRRDSATSAASARVVDERGGYDCEFVEAPKELQTDCPVCLVVLRDPCQVTCCGNIYCRNCIERVKQYNRPCPTCNSVDFNVFPDKKLQRSLNDFKVCCINKKAGCVWVDELGQLMKHINFHPDKDRLLEGCQFADIECEFCEEAFHRREIEKHMREQCPKRPASCPHCENYESYFSDVANHVDVCPRVSISCPNECGVFIERQYLDHHLKRGCQCLKDDCDFKYAGCMVRLPSEEMQAHLSQQLIGHLALVGRHSEEMAKGLAGLKAELKDSLSEVSQLKGDNQMLRQELAELKRKQTVDGERVKSVFLHAGLLPIDCTMPDIKQHRDNSDDWFSPSFYTRPRGYKMCFEVNARGNGEGRGTHVSVFVWMMRGDFDEQLKWPFRGSITIQLLRQDGPIANEENHTETIVFSDRTPERTSGRVSDRDKSTKGWGRSKFIPHDQLLPHYLKNDSLVFRVVKVDEQ